MAPGALPAGLDGQGEVGGQVGVLDSAGHRDQVGGGRVAADLATVIGQIEFTELSDQLNLLIQSGDLSATDQQAIRAIYARQAALKQAGAAA